MTKKHMLSFSLFFVVSLALFALDPVEGFWKSVDEKSGETTGYWKIYEKSGTLYGELVNVPKEKPDVLADKVKASYKGFPLSGPVNKMKLLGTPWIFGLSKKSEGEWQGGSIIDPADGAMYKCKITYRPADGKKFAEERLEMRGEIGFGIGRSQFWLRAKESDWKQ